MALDLRGEVNLAGTWTDATTLLYQRNPVSVTRGRQNESSTMAPSQATFTVNNRDGRWTVRNPAGAWYGSLVQNTQFRLSVPASVAGLPNYMRLETDQASYASCPDAAAPALVQVKTGSVTGTTLTVTLTNPTTAGNCLVVAIMANGSSTNPTVSTVKLGGAAGNFASVLAAGTATFVTGAIWNDPNCAGGQTAVAVTSTGGSGTITLAAAVYEFSGLATSTPFDKSASAASASTASSWSSTATATLTQASEVAVGLDIGGGTALALTGPGAPWVNTAQFGPASNSGMIAGYNIVSATTALTYAGTVTPNSAHTTLIATFKAAVASPPLQITSGTLSVRADVKITDWTSNHILAAKEGATGNAWALYTNGNGTVAFNHYDAGGTFYVHSSTLPVPYYNQRIAIRADYSIGGQTVTFYTAPTMAGSWTQLGTVRTTAATTQAAAAGQAVQAGNGQGNTLGMLGELYEVQLLATGVLVADPVFTAQTAGTTTFADVQGNTWTLAGTAALSDRLYRFAGELSSLPKASDPSQADLYSDATASGITQRLQQGSNPANSAMYRAFARLPASQALAAYWPCEDLTGSTQIASAIPGGVPMAAAAVTLAGNSSFACSAPIPVLNGAQMAGTVVAPAGFTWTDNVVRFMMQIPSGGDTNNGIVCQVLTTGTVRRFVMVYTTGGFLNMIGYDNSGAQLFASGGVAFSANGKQLSVELALQQSGPNITWHIDAIQPGAPTQLGLSNTLSTATAGIVTQVQFNAAGLLTGTAIGHIAVQGLYNSVQLQQLAQPLNAWLGETAGNRFSRLCSEEGIACRIAGPADISTAMGNQTQQTILALLQECETTDQGMMLEPRQVPGLGYIPVAGLYQQPVALTGNYTAAAVSAGFGATSDDLLVVNDVTATAADGSSSRQVLATGPQSVAAVGRIDTSITVNTQADTQLGSEASWYLHVRTVNDDRYGTLPFQMARSATPVAAGALEIGQYLQLTNTPSWVPPGPVKQLCAGYTETFMPQPSWQIGVNAIPETPYEVGIVGDTVYGHADTDGTTLHAGINNSVTSLQADTAAGFALWTTTAGDFPFDIQVNFGEVMTVTNITGASNPQTFTVTRGVNGVAVAHNALDDIRLAHPMIVAL